jgi:hypothetical protein
MAGPDIYSAQTQIIVLRRRKSNRMPFLAVDRVVWVGPATCFRRPAARSPSFDRIPWFGGIVQVSDCFGAGSPVIV